MKKNSKKKNNLLVWLFATLIFLVYLYVSFSSNDESPAPITAPIALVTSTPVIMGAVTTSPVAVPITDWYTLYFTSPSRPYDKITTGGIEDHLIELIDASESTIDAAFYEFDLENLSQAIIRAKERGVIVRLVYDNEYTDPDPQIAEMIGSGIGAIPDDRSAYMHNKFVIIDNRCVWTGSFNFTYNAAYKNNENAVVICDPRLAQNYTTEFSEMYSGEFGRTSTSDTPHPQFELGTVTIENYFAPEDSVMERVVEEVSQATSSVHFMAFSFTDDTLSQTMSGLIHNSVSVVGIFESRSASNSASACPLLLQSGASISLDGNPYTFHHKVIIVDGKVVIFGSFNFTGNANKNNDENLLIIHDPEFAAEFEREFQLRLAESNFSLDSDCRKK